MNKFKEKEMYRHGEIVLKPVSEVGEGKTSQERSYIVGHSETGHHHVLESTRPYTVTRDRMNKLWLELEVEAELVHKKDFDQHNTLTIAPGKYEVIQKNEYNPFTKMIQQVQD